MKDQLSLYDHQQDPLAAQLENPGAAGKACVWKLWSILFVCKSQHTNLHA
jgi:hypothetical protein